MNIYCSALFTWNVLYTDFNIDELCGQLTWEKFDEIDDKMVQFLKFYLRSSISKCHHIHFVWEKSMRRYSLAFSSKFVFHASK